MRDRTVDIGPIEIAEDVRAIVKPELAPDEQLLWAARSRPNSETHWAVDLLLAVLAFGPLAIGVGCFWLASSQPDMSKPLQVIGLGSGLIGLFFLGFLVWYVFVRWKERGLDTRRTYALTDRRAIVWMAADRSGVVEVCTYLKGSFKSIKRFESPDGSGDIQIMSRLDEENREYWSYLFEKIANVRQVEMLIQRTLMSPGPGANP